ncbi:MAG: hypothetical protein IPL83_00255 [Bdellovibrionales bacterium]|nr:hypothetical protein [Bdellovibrionales bacterium]
MIKRRVYGATTSPLFKISMFLMSSMLFALKPALAQSGPDIELGGKILAVIQENKPWISESDYSRIEAKWKIALKKLVAHPNSETSEGSAGFFRIFVDNIDTWEISFEKNDFLFKRMFAAIIGTRGLSYPLNEIMKLAIPIVDLMQKSMIDRKQVYLSWINSYFSLILENAIERSTPAEISETLDQPLSKRILLSSHLFLKSYLIGLSRSKIFDYEYKHLLAKTYLSKEFPGEIQSTALDVAANAAWDLAQDNKKIKESAPPIKEIAETVQLLKNYFFELSHSQDELWLQKRTIKGIAKIPFPTQDTKDFLRKIAIDKKNYPPELRQVAFDSLLRIRGYLDPGGAYAGGPPDHLWLRNLRVFISLKYELVAARLGRSCRALLR